MRKTVCVALVALALAGCKKEIYHGLNELEANQIVVELADKAGIAAEKLADKGEAGGKKGPQFLVSVDEEDAVRAQRTLLDLHLPPPHERGLAEVFETPSMIPTPTEEHARNLMALEGTLQGMLTQIDGVVDARVEIVLPESNPLESGKDLTPARAAVLIKHYPKKGEGAKEADKVREDAEAYHALLVSLNEDLKSLRVKIGHDMALLLKQEDDEVKTLDTYFGNDKRGDDPESKIAREAFRRLQAAALKRDGVLTQVMALPKVKDLDHVLAKITDLELEALPFSSASVRALIAHSTPRLSEDDVDVEFSRVLPKTVPVKSDAVMRASWDKPEVIMGLAALAAVLACLLIGLAIAWSGLKKQLAQARAAAAKAAQQQFSGSMNAQAPMAPPQ